jgi:hypothetical protein
MIVQDLITCFYITKTSVALVLEVSIDDWIERCTSTIVSFEFGIRTRGKFVGWSGYTHVVFFIATMIDESQYPRANSDIGVAALSECGEWQHKLRVISRATLHHNECMHNHTSLTNF